MKTLKLLPLLSALVFLLSATACGKPIDTIDGGGCDSYLTISGDFRGTVDISQDGAPIVEDGPALIRIYQSGGAGTNWARVTGTARAELIKVEFTISIANGTYTDTLVGTAYPTSAVFDETIVSPNGSTEIHYEFKDLKPAEETVSGALETALPEFTFDTWRDIYGVGVDG